jgi:hypothetical protein
MFSVSVTEPSQQLVKCKFRPLKLLPDNLNTRRPHPLTVHNFLPSKCWFHMLDVLFTWEDYIKMDLQ